MTPYQQMALLQHTDLLEKMDKLNKAFISNALKTKKILHVVYATNSSIAVDVNVLNKNDLFQREIIKKCYQLGIRHIYGTVLDTTIKKNDIIIDIFVNDYRLPHLTFVIIKASSDNTLLLSSPITKQFLNTN